MTETDKQHNTRLRGWKRLGIAVLILLAVLVSLSLIVHIPAVQNWGVRQITHYLSEKTNSTVSVRAFDLNAFSHFNLKDVYFSQESAAGDTLLYAGEIGVRFSKLWKLFSGRPEITSVHLRKARLYIDDRPITFLSLAGKKKNAAGFKILSPEIGLDDVLVRISKSTQNMTQQFLLPKGVIAIDEIDTEQKVLQLESVHIEGPSVLLMMKPEGSWQADSTFIPLTPIDSFAAVAQDWILDFQKVIVSDGHLKFIQDDAGYLPQGSGMDYHDLDISDLDIVLRNVCVDDSRVTGEVREISFAEKSGFTMDNMSAKRIELSQDGIALGGIEIRTPHSMIMDTLALDFGDPAEGLSFAERVSIYARFKDAQIAFFDLLTAIPDLQNSAFFDKNRDEVVHIDGIFHGGLDRLRGDSLHITLGDMAFSGQFRSRNLTIHGKQILNLVVSNAHFTPRDLEKHIPGVALPEQFGRLGKIQFQGKFDGFLDDFVAYGKVTTDLGKSEVDMNLVTTENVARYKGVMLLQKFNLQKWTGNADFGLISANLSVNSGSGLTAETAVADVSGSIEQFQYKGYTYADVLIDGRLNRNHFDGKMEVHGKDVNLVFQGAVVANQGEPIFDFTANVKHIDFQKLHLSKDTFTLAGLFVARGQGKDLNTLIGTLQASDMKVVRGHESYALDTFFIDIERPDDGLRFIRTTSDYVNGWISGDFELISLYPSIAGFLEESYPQYFTGINYRKDLSLIRHRAEFEVTLNKPEEWQGLLNLEDIRFNNLHASGLLNFEKDSVIIDIAAPEFHYRQLNAYEFIAHLESISGQANAQTSVAVIDVDEKYFFDEIVASVETTTQGFSWTLSADDLLEELNTLGLSGTFTVDSNKIYALHVDPNIIEVLNQKWELREGNYIRFGKDFIELRDIVFRHDDQVITIADVERRGIMIESQQFDLSVIDDVWDYEKLDFAGPYTLRAGLSDVFAKEGFYARIDAPEVLVNGDVHGALHVNCTMDHLGMPVSIFMGLERPGSHLTVTGTYYPPVAEVEIPLRNMLDLDVKLDTFPIAFFEYFLKDGVHNTTGYAIGGMRIQGPLKNTKMDGKAMIHDGATTISYLGTRYFFDKTDVHISESVIDATGAILTDTDGNTATVTGGLTHRRLGNLGLDARIRSPRIIALNTDKEDNSVYYGLGIGSIDALFRGSVERPTISVDAVTDQGTYIVINLADESAAQQKSFVRFRSDLINGRTDLRNQTSITGMNFEMNLSATQQAVMEIILEDNPPESIIGTGNGNIQLSITRTGDFTMYGQYVIDHGNYLFRSFVVINKPFDLRRGGTIQWGGDPYNAEINLEAEYVGLRASLSTLLAEYLTNASDAAREEAGRKTDVLLRLLLTGTLLEPEINFDFSFPNLSGELAGYADTKLRVLKSNQNALNEQVFGLLWAGSFLPSNILQTEGSLQLAEQGISNTMSEFLSNQVSSLFSSVISRWVEGVDFISGIDFDVGYSQGSVFDYPDAQNSSSSYREWEVRVKNRLLNDRVIIDAGANYGTDSPIGTGTYFVGDYAIEYLLTKDGRLKIRFYYRNDQTIEGRKNKFGLGLAWRREFDSFDEWLGGLKKETKKLSTDEGVDENVDQ